MVEAEVSLYLISRARIARLQKTMTFVALPRVREFVKVRNREQGDYFAFTVVQVTHREDRSPAIWLELTTVTEGRSVIDFLPDEELDEYIEGYRREDWTLESLVANRTVREDGTSAWTDPLREDGT